MVGVERDPWMISSQYNYTAKVPIAGCPETCTGMFGISSEERTPQPPWTACYTDRLSSCRNKTFLYLKSEPLMSICGHWFLSSYHTLLCLALLVALVGTGLLNQTQHLFQAKHELMCYCELKNVTFQEEKKLCASLLNNKHNTEGSTGCKTPSQY